MTGNQLLALTTAAGVLLAVCRPARRIAWAILRGTASGLLAIAVAVAEHHRTRRERPPAPHQPHNRPARQPPPPMPQRWRVRLSTRVDGFPAVLADGEVVGPWQDAAEVRHEALTRLVEAVGQPAGRVYAEAWPIGDRHTTAA